MLKNHVINSMLTALFLTATFMTGTAMAMANQNQSGLRLLSAYYMPDPPVPANSNSVEGDLKPPEYGLIFEPMQRLYEEHADFGGARVVFHNDSSAPVQISNVRLNGKTVEEHYVDFLNGNWDDRGVVWYRVRPQTLAPGQAGELYIRFRRRPEGTHATVTIDLDNGSSLEASFPYEAPGVQVDYVTTDASRERLYVYARRDNEERGALTGLALDGQPVTDFDVYGAEFPGNVALAIIHLPAPLELGDYHIAEITTENGNPVAAQFRVLPFIFLRTSFLYFADSAEEARELGMNMTDWRHNLNLQQAKELGVYTNLAPTDNSPDVHARQIWRYMFDEPDAKDQHPNFGSPQIGSFLSRKLGYTGEPLDYPSFRARFPQYSGLQWAVGLGRQAREYILGQNLILETQQSPVASYLIVNGTTRPLNWFVYGQLTDIAGTDPYPVNLYGADLVIVREQYKLMRQASMPRPTYGCLEAYTTTRHLQERPNAPHRAPSAAEFHQMGIQALGSGVKGYTSWFWATGSGMTGAGHIPHLREAYIRLNKLTEHIETELMLGTPADLAVNDSGLTQTGSFYFLEEGPYQLEEPWMNERVWTGALICGPDAVVVAAANHIPASRMSSQKIEPSRNVTITVDLPDYLADVNCFEVDADGLEPYQVEVTNGKARIFMEQITDGRIFLLRRK